MALQTPVSAHLLTRQVQGTLRCEEKKEYPVVLHFTDVAPGSNTWQIRMECPHLPELWFEFRIRFNLEDRDWELCGVPRGRLCDNSSQLHLNLNEGRLLVTDMTLENPFRSVRAQLPVVALRRAVS